jgi:hypothetical protein
LVLLLVVPYVLPLLAFGLGYAGRLVALPLATVFMAMGVARAAASTEPDVLIAALKRCAELELWFALTWAAGMVL